MVREGSVQLNLPELTSNCPSDKLPPSSQWFEEVRSGRTTQNCLKKLPCSPASPSGEWFEEVWCGRTTPYSLEPAQQACFPICHSGSKRFGVVEPPQTYSNLPCRPASPFVTVVPGGSVWSNCHELTRT